MLLYLTVIRPSFRLQKQISITPSGTFTFRFSISTQSSLSALLSHDLVPAQLASLPLDSVFQRDYFAFFGPNLLTFTLSARARRPSRIRHTSLYSTPHSPTHLVRNVFSLLQILVRYIHGCGVPLCGSSCFSF